MNIERRKLLSMAGLAPALALAGTRAQTDLASPAARPAAEIAGHRGPAVGARLVLTDFQPAEPAMIDGCTWRGFSDRVMGGVSDGTVRTALVAGRRCLRMTGWVTRDSGGGFIQMAMSLGGRGGAFDASAYQGLEFLVHGNDEDYNIHIRTADTRWYSQSYRTTIHAGFEWQRIRLPWSAFAPNEISAALNTSGIQRVGLLGWMREFEADLCVAEVSLYA